MNDTVKTSKVFKKITFVENKEIQDDMLMEL